MKHYFLVAHTHWDKEWHKTYQENRVRLVSFMADLLDALETGALDCFVLDGQTSLLLDYLDVCPEEEGRLRRCISAEKLVVGPWYVQPDVNIPSSEALLRNLLISKQISDRFGPYMEVGYLPDSFGMSADVPTLLRAFGIQDALFYRGLSSDDTAKDVFWWEGPDGSRVLCCWMPDGYGNAMFLAPDAAEASEQVREITRQREARSVREHFLLMGGSDQCYAKRHFGPLSHALPQRLSTQPGGAELSLCTPADCFDSVRESGEVEEVFCGEMRRGRHSRTHISISATRLDIKRQNFNVDAQYKYLLEPLCATASLCGADYPDALIRRGWRYILENHAHDTICCCCTDAVHREVVLRLEAAQQIGETLTAQALDFLYRRIRFDREAGRPVLLFSSFPGTRRELTRATVYVKEAEFRLLDGRGRELPYAILGERTFNLKDAKVSLSPIPDDFYREIDLVFYAGTEGVGYTACYIQEGKAQAALSGSLLRGDSVLENKLIRCTVNADGTLDLLDKRTGRAYPGQHLLVDGGNAGDEYDYSPPRRERLITSQGTKARIRTVLDTPLRATLEIACSLQVPADTDGHSRSCETVPLEVLTRVSIGREDGFLDLDTEIHNGAKNHRLQVLFDLGLPVETHIADVQLGELERENESPLTAVSEDQGWSERYYPIYSQQKYTALTGGDGRGLMIMNQGLPQYEILQGETTRVALTLLSCVGMMGNENLLNRPGRRSGAVCPTPDSQMGGVQTARYRLCCIDADFDRPKAGEVFSDPIVSFCRVEYETDGVVPDEFYPLRQEGGLTLKAFKRSESGSGYVARFGNPGLAPLTKQCIETPRSLFASCRTVDAAERPVENEAVAVAWETNPDCSDPYRFTGSVEVLSLPSHGLVTLEFSDEGGRRA